MPATALELFAANLGEAEDAVVRIIGNSLYVRYGNDPVVLKITTQPGVHETKIALAVVHPEHGPIDETSFTLTRSMEFSAALERLNAYQDIWFA
ncbi:hypothetical protein [Streptomyces sp. NPDC056165]|uniref:hypothetical protein n=1 Tax=Streptomyces sp. NPDC056165 TaxID=3345733 RepID=UPI0035E39472